MQPSTKFGGHSKFPIFYLEVLSIIKKKNDPEDMIFTAEEEHQFLELAKDPNAYTKMINSVAPNLYGIMDEKEGCLLSLFGSSDEVKEDITLRGNIHVLLVGDPMTGKSQLLEAIMTIAPKAYFSSGRGTTNAGLTATVLKNPATGEWEYAGGVLVMANNGVACIDEIDKMKDEDRGVIHRAMEQQKVSINKADVHVDMSARTAVIATANPHLGRYDSARSMIENLPKFPIELFSRFDLIFVLLDNPNRDKDTKLGSHVLGTENKESPIPRAFLKKYVAYSKRVNPTLPDEVNQQLLKDYVETRQRYASDQKQMIFGTRQLEGLRRLTLARARASLRTEATLDDLKDAKRVFEQYLLDIGKDLLGQFGGVTKTETKLVPQLQRFINDNGPISKEDLRNIVNCDNADFERAWKHLISNNMLYEPCGDGKFKLLKPLGTLA
jgi:replicative DNA helicase Mcm